MTRSRPETTFGRAVATQFTVVGSVVITIVAPKPSVGVWIVLIFCTMGMQGLAALEWGRLYRQRHERGQALAPPSEVSGSGPRS